MKPRSIKKLDKSYQGLNDINNEIEDNPVEKKDYFNLSNEDIRKEIYNQIMTQALKDEPQASILLYAAKLVNLEQTDTTNALETVSTEELISKVKSFIIN